MTDSSAPRSETNPSALPQGHGSDGMFVPKVSDDNEMSVGQSLPPSDYRICCPGLPLAVYREVMAHLRQVDGVAAGLLPQTSQEFNYDMSQIGGLWLAYQADVDEWSQQRVEEILAYYSDRFGTWEIFN